MSMFFIFMALIVISVAFFHYTQGFFSGALSAILAVFSAVLALSYHETIVEAFLGGAMADSAHAMVLIVLFAAIYTILRTAFDQLVPGGVSMPAMANKIGGAAMGLIAGIFAAGICAFAAQSMSFNPAIMGYSRVITEEQSATISDSLESTKKKSYPLYDMVQSNKPLHEVEESDHQKMYLPVDDILVDTTKLLSERGALSTSKPLSSIHPDWLTELFGQRLGIEAGGKRVAMNLSGGKQTDVIAVSGPERPDAGVYLIDRPLPQKLGEQTEISKISFQKNEPFTAGGKDKIAIVVRVYMGSKAMDMKNNVIELSAGAVRLVTQRPVEGGDGLEWANYHPVGTLEGGIVYRQRPDDYLFAGEGGVVDFVFVVNQHGFLKEAQTPKAGAKPEEWAAFRDKLRVNDGSFIEVKRLAREDLSDQPLNDLRKLFASKDQSTLIRKEIVKPPPEKAGLVKSDQPVAVLAPQTLLKKAIGDWEGTVGATEHRFSITDKKITWSTKEGEKTASRTSSFGTLKNQDGNLVMPAPQMNETFTIQVSDGSSINLTDKGGTTYNLIKSSTPAPAGDNTNPATPPGPAPVTVKADPSIQLLALPDENAKFFQAISVPAGTSGEVAVDGGKITVIDKKIAALSLNDADQAKLKGAGDPVNIFMKPDGMILLQAEAVSGDNSWNFKNGLGQIAAYDAAGKSYPLVGFWATANEKLVARFNPDGGLSLDDYQPTAPPKQIFLMFKGPEGTTITKVMIGQAPIAVKQ